MLFTPAAWDDYLHWQDQDHKTLRRVNALIEDALKNPFAGLGKPESLKQNLSGFWSRRIDDTHRLVYSVEDGDLAIFTCRYHYQ